LPRLQLLTANSDKCKSGDFPINHYALVQGQTFTDLSESVDILVIAWRPKAMEIGDEIITCYKHDEPEFKRIQEKSDEKDSGCMFGPEFLIWIPTIKKFATFFMGSKSSRREAPNVKAKMRSAATLKSHEIKTKKFTWWAPAVTACSTPFDMPDDAPLKEEYEKFMNPPVTEVESADEAEKASTERDR